VGLFRNDRPPTGGEVRGLVGGMDDKRLSRNFRDAKPGTAWHDQLSEEIGRRDAQGTGLDDED